MSRDIGAPIWFTLAAALWGQTIGKHLVGIRVCSGRDLDRPGWLRAAKRWILFPVVGLVPWVGAVLPMLIPLPLLWTTKSPGPARQAG